MEAMRLNKYLSELGICSRREADRLIEAGKVVVDGEIAQMGSKVMENQEILVDGTPVKKADKKILLAYNKPKGVVCSTKEKDNIVEYLNYPVRIYPIGRLDKNSTGLLLLTNRGELSDAITRGSNYHEKEYIVRVNKKLTDDFIRKMGEGVPILDTVTRKCTVEKIDDYKFRIILTQGLNRQIRRMCEYFDYRVTALKRVRVLNIRLGNLRVGEYREVTKAEESELLRMLRKKQQR